MTKLNNKVWIYASNNLAEFDFRENWIFIIASIDLD